MVYVWATGGAPLPRCAWPGIAEAEVFHAAPAILFTASRGAPIVCATQTGYQTLLQTPPHARCNPCLHLIPWLTRRLGPMLPRIKPLNWHHHRQ